MSLPAAGEDYPGLRSRPYCLRILAENALRALPAPGAARSLEILAGMSCDDTAEIEFRPARILSQDMAGVPMIADLAALRDRVAALGGEPGRINPAIDVDLVVDHSLVVEHFGTTSARGENERLELTSNVERFAFLRWAAGAFERFRVIPPGKGICHQINLEYLASVVRVETDLEAIPWLVPDTVLGIDSHTTMINGLGVLGWGTGGIEVELAMMGEPVTLPVPRVTGVRLTGELRSGVTPTDVVLMITERLRQLDVVGKFVEFFGPALARLSVPDRATIANMAPDYGAVCGYFPIDAEVVRYLALTGRNARLVKSYARAQQLWYDEDQVPNYDSVVEIDLGKLAPCVAGPKRPQDRLELSGVPASFRALVAERGTKGSLPDGAIAIAAITSCTNTSNPTAMIGAGLLAKRAVDLGLGVPRHVKTSFAPGSQVVEDYLRAGGLQSCLDRLGFSVVGFGCASCIGNSGPLVDVAADAFDEGAALAAIFSGNRNFEGRVHPAVRGSYLASPALVVAYAIAGTALIDLDSEPLGKDSDGNAVFLRDLWPTNGEIEAYRSEHLQDRLFRRRYAGVEQGARGWEAIPGKEGALFDWDEESTFLLCPPFVSDVDGRTRYGGAIGNARILLIGGDSVSTDHISPAGAIDPESPAGRYLRARSVITEKLGTYGARRGNHEVMMRGTFSNRRLKNNMVAPLLGGFTRASSGEVMPVYDAAASYKALDVPLVIFAGREYGIGSSRDWAAKGTALLGVRAVIAESFERIHRSNLVGMAVLPLQFADGLRVEELGLTGSETVDVVGDVDRPHARLHVRLRGHGDRERYLPVLARIDTESELTCFRNGGMLPLTMKRALQ